MLTYIQAESLKILLKKQFNMKVSRPLVFLLDRSFPTGCCVTVEAVPVCRRDQLASLADGGETRWMQTSNDSAPDNIM